MRDVPEKTRWAVQMALAARALVAATPDPHRKRVIGRYAFVYLHDVVRFAPAWRNQVERDPRGKPAADAALPALRRLQRDWQDYQDVRHFIGAKRQPRDRIEAAVDQVESFELWADIGELSVGALVDDAVELYVQLAATTQLPPIDLAPAPSNELREALASLDAVGEAGLREVTATSFGAGRVGAFPARQGGAIGRLVPLLNDIAENIQTLRAMSDSLSDDLVFDQLIRCQLPAELDELLRLAIGPASGLVPSQDRSLLDLYEDPDKPAEPRKTLKGLRDALPAETRDTLRDWRNRLGAHIDADTPWSELRQGIESLDVQKVRGLVDHVLLWLEIAAIQPGGPVLLLLSARRMKGVIDALPSGSAGLPYADPDVEPGGVPSALAPPELDSDLMVWVGGPGGSYMSAAVAGMLAGRSRDVQERLAAAQKKRSPARLRTTRPTK